MVRQSIRLFFVTIFIYIAGICSAEIFETNDISEVLKLVERPNTLVLFDMDDTLTDSSISAGTASSRAYLKKAIASYEKKHGKTWQGNLYDLISYQIAKRVPVELVEQAIPQVVHALQTDGQPVFVFTARGESKWYTTDIPGIDTLTTSQLCSIGLNFAASKVPLQLAAKPMPYFEAGVIYCGSFTKGPFLADILKDTGYEPTKVIFVDDKLEQVESVEHAMKHMGIPFDGVWYRRIAQTKVHFDPLIALIQIRELLLHDRVISDQEALQIKAHNSDIDADGILAEIIRSYSNL